MATSYLILGQSAPANTSNADLYASPSNTQSVVSTVAIANTTTSAALATVYVRKATAGTPAAAAASNALVYQQTIPAASTQTYTLGITLAASDVITVNSSVTSALTFHAFGSQIA